MFQAILERILKKILGEYFDGIDSNNLGVALWSGFVTIQNVTIKKEALAKLGLPAKLLYSYIKSLKLQIPWKSLSTSKIEIYFEGLYLILGSQKEEEWPARNEKVVASRVKEVEDYAAQIIKKFQQNQEAQKESQSGYTDKLLIRIIDNLQIQIKDIHVAYQDEAGFSFGVTLEQFKLKTVNKEGQDQFVDRTKEENKNQPIRKRMDLSNLGIYWNCRNKAVIPPSLSQLQQHQALKQMIKRTNGESSGLQYLILINSEARLLQRPKGVFKQAETTLEVTINSLNVDVENKQLQQMINLSELIQRYQQTMKLKTKVSIDPQAKKLMIEQFGQLYRKYLSTDGKLEPSQNQRYEAILEKIETVELANTIKSEIMNRQRKKMIEKKEVKKLGWISYGKKQLNQAEMKQIQKFLQQNFSQSNVKISRPEAYEYMQLKLQLNQATFSIGRNDLKVNKGIMLQLSSMVIAYSQRTVGYKLRFNLGGLAINLYQKSEQNNQLQPFFYKLSKSTQNYVQILVEGNPIGQEHIDTALTVKVQQSVMMFTPIFITRLKRFIDLKIAQDNKDKARERIGELKDKTNESIASTIQTQKIKVIALDVSIMSPLIILPFEPNSNGACWCLDTGQLKIQTDESCLDPKNPPILQKYRLSILDINFMWFSSCIRAIQNKAGEDAPAQQELIKEFSIVLDMSLRKNNSNQKLGDFQIRGVLPQLALKLSKQSYDNLLRIGTSFQDKAQTNMLGEVASISMGREREAATSDKKQILNGCQKMGMIYKRSNATKIWTKYICLLKQNYLYFFADKQAQEYEFAVYVRNSTFEDQPQNLAGRPNSFVLNNVVDNGVWLSLDKPDAMQQWKDIINTKKDEQSAAQLLLRQQESQKKLLEQHKAKTLNYDQLKVDIKFEISSMSLGVYQGVNRKAELSFKNLCLGIELYQARKCIQLSLKMIQLKDMIEEYQDHSLNYLLYTEQESDNLMELHLRQVDKSDPTYENIDNDISIQFGVLCLVCKPKTISRLLIFFIPSKSAENQLANMAQEMKKQDSKMQHQSSVSTASDTINIMSDVPEQIQFSLKLQMKFKELKVMMVNRNIKLRQGYLNLQSFVFQLKLSNQGINLQGGLSKLSLSDCTSHPDTLYRQSQWSNHKQLILLTNSSDNDAQLLMFNISIQDRPKQGTKPMHIKILVKDIVVDYYQQPVLRMLHYILNQVLPSLLPDTQSNNRKLLIEYPEQMKFNLDVTVINTIVRLRPHPTSKDMLRLNVGCVEVKNKDIRQKYTHNDTFVMASAFLVTISGLQILYNSMPLTNQFNFYLKVSLIQSPDYYRFHLREEFNPGIRIDCRMSPFLLRIGNLDYRFIMKCLNWNIAYDDGCDRVLFPQKFQNVVVVEKQQDEDPIYFILSIDMLTLLVTESQVPISNMTLNQLSVTFTGFSAKMIVTVTIRDIIGSSFRKVGNNYQERGIIRDLGTNRMHPIEQLNDIKDLVRLFYRSVPQDHGNRLNNDLSVLFERTKSGDMLAQVTLNRLQISLQLRPLLKLVNLISLDESVKAPPPRLSAQIVVPQASSIMKFRLIANEISFRAATDDANQQLGLAGQFFVDMTMKPPMNVQQVLEQCKIQEMDSNIENSRLAVTINYLQLFLLQNDGTKIRKRTLLNPSNIILVTKQAYSIKNQRLVLLNQVILKLQFIVLQATVSDINKLVQLSTQAMAILNQNKQQGARTMSAAQLQAEQQQRMLENQQQRQAKQFKALISKMENTNQVIRETVAQVSIRELRVSVLYNSKSIYIPVLMFELFQTNPVFKSNLLLAQLSLTCFTQLSFFNPRSSSWQPVIQKNCLEIQYVCTQKQTSTETVIAIQNGSDALFNRLNINISSQFLTSLAEIMSTLKKQMDSKQSTKALAVEQEELEVSPYVIQNMTFQDIEVYSSTHNSTKIELPSRKKAQSNYNKGRPNQFYQQSRRFIPSRTKRSVYIGPKQKQMDIRIGDNKVKVNIEGYAKKRLGLGQFIVETTVQKLNRLLRISGDVLINKTTRVIQMEVDNKWLTIQPQEMVPFSTIKRFRMGPKKDLMCNRMDKEDLFVNTSLSCDGKFYYNLIKREQQIHGLIVSYFSVYSPLKLINCLPKPLQLQVIYKNKTTANRQLKEQTDYEIYSHASGQQVKIKISMPGFFWSHDVSIAHSVDKQLDIVVKDQQDIPLTIRALMIKNQETQCITISFFCQAYLLNETPYAFTIYGKKNKHDKYKKVAAQKSGQQDNDLSLVLIGQEVGNYIKLASTENQLTPKIFIGGIDNSDVQLKLKKEDNSQSVVLFSAFTSIKQMHKDSAVVCKQVRIVPKHVLVNNTSQRLFVKQEGDNKEIDIAPTQRKILEYKPNLSKKGIYRLEGSEQSTPILTFGLGVVYFYIMQQGVKLHMKIQIDTADKYVMIVVSVLQLKNTPYCLVNKCKKATLRIPTFNQIIKPGEHFDFSWRSPQDSHLLKIMTQYESIDQIKEVEINCDKVGSTSRVEIKPPEDWLIYVIFTVRLKGQRRIIEVIEKSVRIEQPKNIVLRTICLKLATISVSLSLNHGTVAKPYEAFNLTIFDLELVDQLGTMQQIYQARLRFLQLDQNNPHLSPIPVVLTPSKYKLYMDKDNPRKILNLLIRRDSQARRSVTLLEVALQINPLTVRISQMFIKLMLEMLREFTSVMDVKQQEYLIQRKKDQWANIPVVFTRNPVYINEIRISPLDLDITAQLKPPDEGKNIVILRMILKGFGLVVANIDQAPIRLNGISISGCLDSLSGIIQKLTAHYKKNFILQVYKLFGSFNALGNPASLFSNIATGLGDLVQKPAQGLVKGPLELGLGIVQGTHSLVAHTIGGAFNSVSKITGTISSGIALLAFDKNFEAMREKQRLKKPKNVLQGLEKGAKAIYCGFKEGMTGVFLKPFEEAKKDGVLGFFRGTAQGITGVIIKPVTGILDFAANTTQGIKNTALYFQDKANENRMRCPIVFYGRNSQMHQYIAMDTQINNVLQPMKRGRFSDSMFIKAFMLQEQGQILAILNNFLVMLSLKKKTLLWYIKIRSIKNTRIQQGVVKLSLSENHKYFDGPIATIESTIPEQQQMIKQLIDEQVQLENS